MSTWKSSQGLRGSLLETMINESNRKYEEHKLALVQKIPTPITPVKMQGSKITLAFFEQKSTVDYLGCVQGIPICFDAKECNLKSFPLKNIHEHQLDFMKKLEEQNGVAFFIIYFKELDKIYYVPYKFIQEKWDLAKKGGKKSFNYQELDETLILKQSQGILVPYLDAIKIILEREDTK